VAGEAKKCAIDARTEAEEGRLMTEEAEKNA
jgi:hypothetical protein